MFFSDQEIDRFIEEDLPYFDLTTEALGIGAREGRMRFQCREGCVAAATEEAARILEKVGARVLSVIPSGEAVGKGAILLEAEGEARALHQAWKVCQNLLEYAGGIATYTRAMVEKADGIPLFTTRKSPPGFKKIAMKAVVSGGGHPHRLGLSETFLLFSNHRAFLDAGELLQKIAELPETALLEKTLAVETDSLDDALLFAEEGVRLFQLEKFSPDDLGKAVDTLKSGYPDIRLLATGGIRLENVADYAATGVDGLITTAPYYFAATTDIGAKMERI
jgi:molybdenum transport protein